MVKTKVSKFNTHLYLEPKEVHVIAVGEGMYKDPCRLPAIYYVAYDGILRRMVCVPDALPEEKIKRLKYEGSYPVCTGTLEDFKRVPDSLVNIIESSGYSGRMLYGQFMDFMNRKTDKLDIIPYEQSRDPLGLFRYVSSGWFFYKQRVNLTTFAILSAMRECYEYSRKDIAVFHLLCLLNNRPCVHSPVKRPDNGAPYIEYKFGKKTWYRRFNWNLVDKVHRTGGDVIFNPYDSYDSLCTALERLEELRILPKNVRLLYKDNVLTTIRIN